MHDSDSNCISRLSRLRACKRACVVNSCDDLAGRHPSTLQCTRSVRAGTQLLGALSLQRYSKMPVIGDSFGASTCIAFDLMSINLADLPALPRLVPALKVVD